MADDADGARPAPIEGQVLLPLPDGVCLRMQAHNGPDQDAAIKPKCRLGHADGKALEAAMGQGARMVRLLEPHRPGTLRNMRLELSAEPPVRAALPQGSTAWADLASWAAAAGAWADRIARRMAIDWARNSVLLAGLDLGEEDPCQWGVLHPLAPALEQAVVRALLEGPEDAPWADALMVLPGDEATYAPLRRELVRRWPRAVVCTADSLAALTGPEGNSRRPRVGVAWFALLSAAGAQVQRIRVMVSPWERTRAEPAPVDVVFEPAPPEDGRGLDLTTRVPRVLRAWRENEGPAAGESWKTVVQLPASLPQAAGESYELALCMADRIARGREWAGPGRIFATGGVNAVRFSNGQVLPVSGTVATPEPQMPGLANHKLDAFFGQARAGDTVLLPDDDVWRHQVAARLGALREDGTINSPGGALVMFVQQTLP